MFGVFRMTEFKDHAVDPHKRVFIESEPLAVTLCGILMNAGELHTKNVAFFGTMDTAERKTTCQGCKDEARNRSVAGVAHRDYHAVGDADSLPESA